MYAENPKQFNKTYRIQIAHTEQEIDTIIWMGVFCGDKTGFVRPGHICNTTEIKENPALNTCIIHTDYKHRVYGLSANPFHHSSVISAVSGNNEVSMWDMETATRRHMLWASSLPPFSKMTDDVSKPHMRVTVCIMISKVLYFVGK